MKIRNNTPFNHISKFKRYLDDLDLFQNVFKYKDMFAVN